MNRFSARRLTLAALVGAMYVVLGYFGNIFSLTFGVVQCRFAEALMVLPFTARRERMLCRRNLLAPVLAGVVGVAGYFVAEVCIVTLSGGTLQAAIGGGAVAVLPNVFQEVAGGVAFILLAAALDRLQVKKRIFRATYT